MPAPTSYRRGERGTVEPRAWLLELGELDVEVHRYFGLEGWCGSCRQLSVVCVELKARDIEGAQWEFLARLLKLVDGYAKALRAVQG